MGPHAEHPKGLPSHLLRSVSGVKATLFSLCPGPRKGLNRLSISRKLWVSWRAGLGVPSPACLPCPDTALWYQPSVSSAPFQGCGLQRGRYSELPHECRCKDSVTSGGIGLGGVEGRVSEHVCDLEAQPRSERPRGAEQTLAEDPHPLSCLSWKQRRQMQDAWRHAAPWAQVPAHQVLGSSPGPPATPTSGPKF